MSVVEALEGQRDPSLERPQLVEVAAPVPSIHDDMLASIARTALYAPSLPYLPRLSHTTLAEGNDRVVAANAPDETHRLTIVGHDAIRLDDESAVVLPGFRASELLGLIIRVRAIVKPEVYKELGFFSNTDNKASRNSTTTALLEKFTEIQTRSGVPLVTRLGRGGGGRAGMDRFIVTDIRHTKAYKEARKRTSTGLFERYIRDGGGAPGLFEVPSIEAARVVLRSFGGSDMNREQSERFKNLSKRAAATISFRTDEYDDVHPMNVHTAYTRGKIADELSPEWQDRASCGPETMPLFYPPVGARESKQDKLVREAKAKDVCRTCPIKQRCLEDALDRDENEGIWGGLTKTERRKLLKQQALA